MTLSYNLEEHPNVAFMRDIDGNVHIADQMGGTWCDDGDEIELDDAASRPDPSDLCDDCREAAIAEGLLVVAP